MLFVGGLILLLALRTYPRDVAAVLASIEHYGASQGRETARWEIAVRA